ncbi:Hsp70 family protein [Actinokineospora sp. NPDC004072]
MRYAVGIDLGTAFAAAAVSGPGGTRMVPLSPDVVTPAVVYAAPDGRLLTGAAALQGDPDPRRLARGYKRRLGDPTPLVLGGTAYSPAALMAAQLREVLAAVTAAEGGPPSTVVLTCPAVWGPYRREHFADVPRLAGLSDFRLITEPEAAAAHYSAERRLGDGEIVAVYDLGGGTLDTTILRVRPGGMEILGTPEGIEHIGGIDFDEALLAHVDEKLGGAVTALDRDDPAEAAALAEIRALCVRAKEELSIEPDVRLAVPLPAGAREVTVTRLEFNDLIRPQVQLTTEALTRTIASAGLRTDDLSAALLAGGSSRIPLVAQLVSEQFGKPVRVTLHPKFTVALGAAAEAARGAGTPAPAQPPTIPPQDGPAAPPTPQRGVPAAFPAPARRKWLVPVAAALVAVAIAATTLVLVLTNGDAPTAGAGPSSSAPGTPAVPASTPLRVYDGGVISPYHGLVASAENWAGTELGAGGAAEHATISATDTPDGLHVTWKGTAAGQVYLQTTTGGRNLQSYVDAKAALVFDVVVHKPPTKRTTVALHCVYPCVAEVDATTLFAGMAAEESKRVVIPLSCFTAVGLDPTKVNTPFLVYTDGAFDATFSGVEWVPQAAEEPAAVGCDTLK